MLPCASKRLEDRGSLPAEPNATTPPQSWRFFSPMRLVFSFHPISRSDMAGPAVKGMHIVCVQADGICRRRGMTV